MGKEEMTKVVLYSKAGEVDHEFDITRKEQIKIRTMNDMPVVKTVDVPVMPLIYIEGSGKYYVLTTGVGEKEGEHVFSEADCTVVRFKIGGPEHGKPDL
jgi:hypothetical protein